MIRPTRGRAEILGLDAQDRSVETRKLMGYLPGELKPSARSTAIGYLSFLGRLRGGVDRRAVHELAERLELDLGRRLGDLSKGNKQKVGVIAAFMHDPELLILDEPTSGLDPLRQQDVLDLIRERAAAWRTPRTPGPPTRLRRPARRRAGRARDRADGGPARQRCGRLLAGRPRDRLRLPRRGLGRRRTARTPLRRGCARGRRDQTGSHDRHRRGRRTRDGGVDLRRPRAGGRLARALAAAAAVHHALGQNPLREGAQWTGWAILLIATAVAIVAAAAGLEGRDVRQ